MILRCQKCFNGADKSVEMIKLAELVFSTIYVDWVFLADRQAGSADEVVH